MEYWICLPASIFFFYQAFKGLKLPLNKKNDGTKYFTWINKFDHNIKNPSQNYIDFRHFLEGFGNILGGIILLVIF